jgi:hypothetical protein
MSSGEARLAAVNVWSAAPQDVARALDGALGIPLRERDGAEGAGHFSGRAGELVISVHPGAEPGTELAFVVDELEGAIAACAARGARVLAGPTTEPYGLSAHLEGPGELRIELVQPRTTPAN